MTYDILQVYVDKFQNMTATPHNETVNKVTSHQFFVKVNPTNGK